MRRTWIQDTEPQHSSCRLTSLADEDRFSNSWTHSIQDRGIEFLKNMMSTQYVNIYSKNVNTDIFKFYARTHFYQHGILKSRPIFVNAQLLGELREDKNFLSTTVTYNVLVTMRNTIDQVNSFYWNSLPVWVALSASAAGSLAPRKRSEHWRNCNSYNSQKKKSIKRMSTKIW